MATLALLAIFDAVKAELAAQAVTANVVFGKREPAKQINRGAGGRVCFEPGVEGKAGKYVAARDPGRNPKPLYGFREWATVYVWAFDATSANDERKQYEAVRELHDQVVRAIYKAMHGTAQGGSELTDPVWVGENKERTHGAEIKFTLDVPALVPDVVDLEPLATTAQTSVGFAPTLTGAVTTTEVETTGP